MTEPASLYWHDFETWGANPMVDRPAQFAGVRTDLELNIIGRPLTIYAQPTPDFLPHPQAVMITGITPQLALKQGMNEASFAAKIAHEFSQPNTTVVGYNNLKFDDEVTRYLFYRNFYDPYAHTWQNGNSRWDIIDLARACYALRPEGINWPVHAQGHAEGKVSMKLEDLTKANGIDHGQAHDAMADVYATIAVAKLIKTAQPKLYDYSFSMRSKQALLKLIDTVSFSPLVHVSGLYGADQGFVSLVMPLAFHPLQTNTIICWDLRHDPAAIADLSVEELHARLYQRKSERDDAGLATVGLHAIPLNRCPFLAPPKVLSAERADHFSLSLTRCAAHQEYLQQHAELRDKLTLVFEQPRQFAELTDPDLQLYSGPFFSDQDKTNMTMIRATDPQQLPALDLNFADDRLAAMLFRYRARNYPATLTQDELRKWQSFCQQRLESPPSKALSIAAFVAELEQLAEQHQQNPTKLALLQDLYRYAESL